MPRFASRVTYQDARAPVAFLEKAFGFETISRATAEDGSVVHAEMKFGDGRLTIGGEWENVKPPIAVGGANTQNIHVLLDDGVDRHCEAARAAGAVIVQEPQDRSSAKQLPK